MTLAEYKAKTLLKPLPPADNTEWLWCYRLIEGICPIDARHRLIVLDNTDERVQMCEHHNGHLFPRGEDHILSVNRRERGSHRVAPDRRQWWVWASVATAAAAGGAAAYFYF